MKPPAEIENIDDLFHTVITELDVDIQELMAILGNVSGAYSESDEINADVDKTLAILINQTYREAVRRDKNREKYETKSAEDELRDKKGGVLKNKYPNGANEWKAICEEKFCGFDYLSMDNKVDQVLCPVCSSELWIEPMR